MPEPYSGETYSPGELYRLYQQLREIIDEDLLRKDVYNEARLLVFDKLDSIDSKLDGIYKSQDESRKEQIAARNAQKSRSTAITLAIVASIGSVGLGLFNALVHVH